MLWKLLKARNDFEMSFTKNKRSSILTNLTDDFFLSKHRCMLRQMCNLVKLTNVIFLLFVDFIHILTGNTKCISKLNFKTTDNTVIKSIDIPATAFLSL